MIVTVPLLQAQDLHKTYRKNAIKVPVLGGLDLDVYPREFLTLIGASGSGKSTLLHLIGTLDRPDQGSVLLEGKRIDNLPNEQRDRLRNQTFGFIFQFYHLLPEFTTLENVLLPGMIAKSLWGWLGQGRALRRRALALLDRVGLSHRLRHKPTELSGGEMQRAAIARALLNEPRILLADEPTGNLDASSGGEVVRLLRDLNQTDGLTIIMVTHNLDLAAGSDRVVRLVGGKVEDTSSAPPTTIPLAPKGTEHHVHGNGHRGPTGLSEGPGRPAYLDQRQAL
jgi:lipoprotein-releasing system ATP-binding protein